MRGGPLPGATPSASPSFPLKPNAPPPVPLRPALRRRTVVLASETVFLSSALSSPTSSYHKERFGGLLSESNGTACRWCSWGANRDVYTRLQSGIHAATGGHHEVVLLFRWSRPMVSIHQHLAKNCSDEHGSWPAVSSRLLQNHSLDAPTASASSSCPLYLDLSLHYRDTTCSVRRNWYLLRPKLHLSLLSIPPKGCDLRCRTFQLPLRVL